MKSAAKDEKKESSGVASEAMSEKGNDLGVIKIHENVVSTIVRKSVCSVDGVTRLAGSSIVDNIAGLVGSKKMHDRAIAVKMDGPSVEVEVKVNISYGMPVPKVAAAVQVAIADEVEKITGMIVTKVNVIVREIEEVQVANEAEIE